MSEPGGFDYLDSVSKDSGRKPETASNAQVEQLGLDRSPAEGGQGYVGGNTNASTLGLDYVTGKKGTVTDKSIWGAGETSFKYDAKDNSGTGDSQIKPAATESTEESDPAKFPQKDQGLPQTYRSSYGAGDAGPEGSDEPDKEGLFDGVGDGGAKIDTQHIGSEMPQTGFTSVEGGGAPKFKHAG